jgi:hypothetical protein
MDLARRPPDIVHRLSNVLTAASAEKQPCGTLNTDAYVPEVLLVGRGGTLILDLATWFEFLDLAKENGWIPNLALSEYRPGLGTRIAARDAYEIAKALRNVLERLIRHETTTTRPNLPELISDLSEFIAFCCGSGFRIS